MNTPLAERLLDPNGIWPWAEANQGLLSVMALAAAFGIAAWEIRQSARRDQRALAAYIDWVLDSADRSIEVTDDAIRYIDTDGREGEGVAFAVWSMLAGNALATLEEIQPMRPTHPELTHFVNRLMRCMAMKVEAGETVQKTRSRLDDFKAYVVAHRSHVSRFRPRTLGDRLRALMRRPKLLEAPASRVAAFR